MGTSTINGPFSMAMLNSQRVMFFLLVLNVGNGWVAGGCWDEITSDDWDHSRKFPAFSTSKFFF